MGLSGRKVKQRIGNDPRNLSWADDAARFGSNYLSKFGWDASKGLGTNEEGRTSHIKIAHKLDMLGIGAAQQNDPNGIAWKQNKDFENLLKRLNEASETPTEDQASEAEIVVPGFVKPKGKAVDKGDEDGVLDPEKDEVREKKKRKKERREKGTREKGTREEGTRKEKRKRKRDKGDEETDEKPKKKKSDDKASSESTTSGSTSQEPGPVIQQQSVRVVPRHRSHRARHIAAKSMGSKSAVAISEILGIAATPSSYSSTTPSGFQTPQEGKLTNIYDDYDHVDKITTSTKSLQDYFKEKMGLTSSAAVTNLQVETVKVDYDDDVCRGGLGSRPKLESEEDETPKPGLSRFSALMSSSLMASASLLSTPEDSRTREDLVLKADPEQETEKERRRRKKERKGGKGSRRE